MILVIARTKYDKIQDGRVPGERQAIIYEYIHCILMMLYIPCFYLREDVVLIVRTKLPAGQCETH